MNPLFPQAEEALAQSVGSVPFRVLHVLPDVQIGGGQRIVLNGIAHVDRNRFVPAVCYLLEGDEMAPAFAEAGCPPVRVPYSPGTGLLTLIRLVRIIHDQQVDLVYVHSGADRTYGQLAALLTRTPVVGQLHSRWVHLGPMYPDDPTVLQRARARLLGWVRDVVERRTVRHYGADSADVRNLFLPLVHAPISVTAQAVAIDAYDRAAATGARERIRRELGLGDEPMLINVSRLVEGKGQEHLVAMMAKLQVTHPDAVLVLVGGGDRRPFIEQEIARAGLDGQVRLLGDRFDVADLLTAGDIFVFGSESEGFGLVTMEAMAASQPVVAFALPALQEYVVEGTTGHLVPIGDVDALVAAVTELLDDPERAREMGRAGRRVIDERFHPAATAESFEVAYRAALGDAVPRSFVNPRSVTKRR
jgi:glycosyltransferase involved in cell wall biosynthesis